MKILTVVLVLIWAVMTAPAVQFGEGSVKIIFEQKKDSFILFSDSDESEARDSFAVAAEADDSGVYYSFLNKANNKDHFGRFADYLGIKVVNTPLIVFIQEGSKKYIYPSTDINGQDLTSFITKVKGGEVKRFLKSAPIHEEDKGFVKVLVGNNFRDVIFSDERQYLVKFYAPWCGHCKQMAPDYQAVAKAISVNPNIVIAKVDGTLNEVDGVQITGYPTLWFFPKDKTADPLRFNGERDKQGIIDWLRDHTEHDWVEPREQDNNQL